MLANLYTLGLIYSLSLSLSYAVQTFMSQNPTFYLSLAVLVIGILGGLYLFLEWLRHGRQHKFPLLWGNGLLLLYWFQIPFILVNAGVRFTITDFNFFYAFALPTTFGGLVLVYLGILSVLQPPNSKKIKFWLSLWFVACILFFFYYFVIKGGIITDYSSVFIVNLLFFVPARLLILFALWEWLRLQSWEKTKMTIMGIVLMISWAIMGIAGNVFAVKRLLAYPPQFWFIALLEFKPMFLLQAISLLLLVLGFIFVHRNCFRNLNGKKY